jgi:hypothetical protein
MVVEIKQYSENFITRSSVAIVTKKNNRDTNVNDMKERNENSKSATKRKPLRRRQQEERQQNEECQRSEEIHRAIQEIILK